MLFERLRDKKIKLGRKKEREVCWLRVARIESRNSGGGR